MTDPETERVDALARALREIHVKAARDLSAPWPPMGVDTEFEDDATAILAALTAEGWTLARTESVGTLTKASGSAETPSYGYGRGGPDATD